jgi:hypothetical protein
MDRTKKRKLALAKKKTASARKAGATIAAGGLAVSLLGGSSHAYAPAQPLGDKLDFKATSTSRLVVFEDVDEEVTRLAKATKKKATKKKATKKKATKR